MCRGRGEVQIDVAPVHQGCASIYKHGIRRVKVRPKVLVKLRRRSVEDLVQQFQPKKPHGIRLLRDGRINGSVLDCVQGPRVCIPGDELPAVNVCPLDGVGNRFSRNRFQAHKRIDLLGTGQGHIPLGLV